MESESTVPAEKNEENNVVEVKKKPDKDRKKSEKKMDQYMKSIAHLSPEEKIDHLMKKTCDAYDEVRTYKGSIQMLQRRIQVLENEKTALQAEQSKQFMQRTRLESLCRELQRQSKTVKEESLQKIREEEEKRKEVSNRFQTALNEVTQMMQQNTDKNLKLRDDNVEISNKFNKLCAEFKQREEEVRTIRKQMDLEKQLAEATLKKTECQLSAEREGWASEREKILMQLKASEEEKQKFEANLKSMEEHLSVYSSRYEEFESTINKSNQVFESYKLEMSRLTKQVNKLEKDCTTWKDRWQHTSEHLANITKECSYLQCALQDREKKLDKVTKVCKIIQRERAGFLQQLKQAGIPPMQCYEPTETTSTANVRPVRKMSKKEQELEFLKNTVKGLEKQLNETQKKMITSTEELETQKKMATSTEELEDEEPKPGTSTDWSGQISNDAENNVITDFERKNENNVITDFERKNEDITENDCDGNISNDAHGKISTDTEDKTTNVSDDKFGNNDENKASNDAEDVLPTDDDFLAKTVDELHIDSRLTNDPVTSSNASTVEISDTFTTETLPVVNGNGSLNDDPENCDSETPVHNDCLSTQENIICHDDKNTDKSDSKGSNNVSEGSNAGQKLKAKKKNNRAKKNKK